MQGLKDFAILFKTAVQGWMADQASRLSASLAYYSIFSLAPLMIITISMIAIVFGEEAARGQIASQIEGLVGEDAARTIQDAIAKTAESTGKNAMSAVIGFCTMMFGATTVFAELKGALNEIFRVRPKPGNAISTMIQQRVLSFSVVLGIGFMLIVSLTISSLITAVSTYLTEYLPLPPVTFKALDFAISIVLMTGLFTLIFKILPDVQLRWRDAAAGGAVTSVLFNLGKSLIAYYLGTSSAGSAFGASGSLILILLWVYYATGILFLGAEFTKAYVLKNTGEVRPNKHGVLAN